MRRLGGEGAHRLRGISRQPSCAGTVANATLALVLAVISPAKRLDFDKECPFPSTTPPLLRETKQLSLVTRKLSAEDLSKLMNLSRPLAQLNEQRFRDFKATPKPKGSAPASWAFDGDTYTGLRAREFNEEQINYAQEHLVILSGLYGALRPLDAILPYRLEMGTRLVTERGGTLYDFWGDIIARYLNQQLTNVRSDILVNLASQEYFQAVDRRALKARIVTPVFKEKRGNRLQMISFSAKRARGAMARYIVESKAARIEQLKSFRVDGYRFQPELSDDDTLVFVREQQ